MNSAALKQHAGILLGPLERSRAIQAKRNVILGWFRNYSWSHIDVLTIVTGLGRRAVESTLVKMQRDELMRSSEVILVRGRPVRIWGLTHHGAHFAVPIEEEIHHVPVFEPRKVAVSTLEHEISVQCIHAHALRMGWRDWRTANQVSIQLAKGGLKIPDGIATDPSGERTAIEVERTLKSARRYEELLVSYLDGRKRGIWKRVLYLSPSDDMAARVERAYRAIKKARFHGQTFTVTDSHLAPFSFIAFDSFYQEPNA